MMSGTTRTTWMDTTVVVVVCWNLCVPKPWLDREYYHYSCEMRSLYYSSVSCCFASSDRPTWIVVVDYCQNHQRRHHRRDCCCHLLHTDSHAHYSPPLHYWCVHTTWRDANSMMLLLWKRRDFVHQCDDCIHALVPRPTIVSNASTCTRTTLTIWKNLSYP